MRRLLIVFALLGRMTAQTQIVPQCAEHNIYLSDKYTTISTSEAARCTGLPVTFGNGGTINYQCPPQYAGVAGMTIWGFDIQSQCVTSSVAYAVHSLDPSGLGGDHYDIGLYYVKGPGNQQISPGQLVVHTGSLTGQAFTGAKSDVLVTQQWTTPATLPPGQYALALATDCVSSSCAVLDGDDTHGFMYLFDVWLGGSTGSGPNSTGTNLALTFSPGCQPQPNSQITCTLQMTTSSGPPPQSVRGHPPY